jgi:DNA gyrase inhibitor GyrI
LSSQVHPVLLQVLPQSSELPQPSPMVPQYWSPLAVAQVSGVQFGGSPLHRLSLQVHPLFVQVVPQSNELPQPSPMSPQYWSPFAVVQASAVQLAPGPALHRWSLHSQPLFVQVAGQSTELPQPSPMVPQY